MNQITYKRNPNWNYEHNLRLLSRPIGLGWTKVIKEVQKNCTNQQTWRLRTIQLANVYVSLHLGKL